jgi:cobalt-zinc-cadmium efflux system outer membrane protein
MTSSRFEHAIRLDRFEAATVVQGSHPAEWGARRSPRPGGLVALVVIVLVASRAAAQPAPTPVSIDEVVARALDRNPALAAARLRRAVSAAAIDVAGDRPNPDFVFESARDTPHETFSTAWTIETGGKRGRRIDVAQAGVRLTDAELARLTASVVSDTRRAYFALVASRRRAAVHDDLRALALRARDAAHDRFESGAAPRLEALQADIALAQSETEATMAHALADAARAALNTLINEPADAPLVPVDAPVVPEPAAIDAVLAQAPEQSPELAVLDQEIGAAAARAALAKALRSPDPTADVGLTYDAPPEFQYGWKFGFTVAVPVLTRHTAAVRVEEATLAQLRAEREAAAVRVRGAVGAAAARLAAERQAYLRYRDEILPRLDEVERMAEDSYRAGQTGLPALLQSLQNTRDIRLRAVEAEADLHVAISDLEQASGVRLP